MALHNGGWQAFDDDYSGYFVENDDADIIAVFQLEADADEYVNLRQRAEKAEAERDELDAALKTTGERGWYVEYKQMLERVQELEQRAGIAEKERNTAYHERAETLAQLAQVGEYARYYHGAAAKKALFPRDAAPLSFVEWYAKGEE